jgi:molecular chaperone Hsp33
MGPKARAAAPEAPHCHWLVHNRSIARAKGDSLTRGGRRPYHHGMIVRPMTDLALTKRLAALPPDSASIFTLLGEGGPAGGEVRGALLHGTHLVAAMRANHELGILETLVLGHAYLATALMATTLKGEEKIILHLGCEGPARGYSVEGRSFTSETAAEKGGKGGGGRSIGVRGYLLEDHIPVEAPIDSWDTAPFIGKGSLSVTRFAAGLSRPHTGSIALSAGRLAEDLARWYLESEQTRTAFKLGIAFDSEGRVSGAGAIFLQALPGSREDFVSRVEAGLLGLPSLGPWFSGAKSGEDLLGTAFSSAGLAILEEVPASFSCDCSRERFASFLENSNDGLLGELASEGPWPVVITCHNCSSPYAFTKSELETMAAEREGKPREES